MPQYLVAIHHPNNYDPSVEGEAMQRESPSTQMSNQLIRRDFAIRTSGFGLAMGLAPAATLAEAQQASRSETSPAVADPYSLVDPELLPALKQFPAYDLSAEMVGKFRQLPGMPPGPPVPGEWQATPSCPVVNGITSGIAYQWQNVTPFGIQSARDFLLDPPPALTSEAYVKANKEVVTVGSVNSTQRPPDRANVALFYAASSPTQCLIRPPSRSPRHKAVHCRTMRGLLP